MTTGSGNNSSTSTSSGSNTTTACAACKYQRRKCTADCPLSPYFPPDQPKRFQNVHRLFGVSNILRILKHVDPGKRDDAVKSIAYEADTREKDPVHGCLGVITILQNQISKLKDELAIAREQLYLLQQQHHRNLNQQAQMQHIVGSLGGSTSVVTVSSAQEPSGVMMQYNELGNSDHYSSLKSSSTPPASASFEPDQYLRTDNFDVKPAASARFDGNARYTRAAGDQSHTSGALYLQHHHVKLEERPAKHYNMHHGSRVEDHKPAIRRSGLLNLSMTTSDSGVYLTLANN